MRLLQNNTINLNTAGLGWISKTGWTKLCMRTGHDAENVDKWGQINGDSHDCFQATVRSYITAGYAALSRGDTATAQKYATKAQQTLKSIR